LSGTDVERTSCEIAVNRFTVSGILACILFAVVFSLRVFCTRVRE